MPDPSWITEQGKEPMTLKLAERAFKSMTGLQGVKDMTNFSVKNHLLYLHDKPVKQRPSPNHSGHIIPSLIVIHYTGDNSLEGALDWLVHSRGEKAVSAHLVVSKNGEVYQMVPFNEAAWHAGKSEYDGQQSVNQFSIGIENVGIGDVWPTAQVEANRDIIAALCNAYPIDDIVGHEDVARGRKSDPGPRYPWDEVTDVKEL